MEGANRVLEFATQGRVRKESLAQDIFPAIEPNERTTPGGRILLTHESDVGKIHQFTGPIADVEISVDDLTNRQGAPDNGNQLAITILDLPSHVSPEQAQKVRAEILKRVDVLRHRILWYAAQEN